MISPLYAALLALLFIGLSVRTLTIRRKLQIGIGTGDNEQMLRAMRVHSNFAEYTPIALLLALMLELISGPAVLVHLVCACLLVGRAIHAYGVSNSNENYRFRVLGMSLTFASILISALSLLYLTWAGDAGSIS